LTNQLPFLYIYVIEVNGTGSLILMLVAIDEKSSEYTIAVNNATSASELLSDFSFLIGRDFGSVIFDLTHMAAPLTEEHREDYYPGGFGYQPTQHLIEVVSSISLVREQLGDHNLVGILPDAKSNVGKFLADMRLKEALDSIGVETAYAGPATTESGEDDFTRRNLIPLTNVTVSSDTIDFGLIRSVRDRIEGVFAEAVGRDQRLANLFTQMVSEAVDNLVTYGRGGFIAGLYYPRAGEVEITLMNRHGGFGGSTACEQLEALIEACERRKTGGSGGNGLAELTTLTEIGFGTLLIRNGNAKLSLPPDGSVVGVTDETGIDVPGASVTILLQLTPADNVTRNPTMEAYEAAIRASLERYINGRHQPVNRDRQYSRLRRP
jgi:hypothetical protein